MGANDPAAKSCLPTTDQALLLHAGLNTDKAKAAAAWQKWLSRNDIQNIHASSTRILPLVFRNLSEQDIGKSYPVLKGIYRRNLYKNRIMFARAVEMETLLQEKNIPVLYLKGTGLLAAGIYSDTGVRYMSDIDMLVKEKDAHAAWRIFRRNDWQYRQKDKHARSLDNLKDCIIDLHKCAMGTSRASKADRLFWQTSITSRYQNHALRIPDPAMQLLQALLHGCSYSKTPSTQWVADSVMICRHGASPLNWELFMEAAELRRVQGKIRPMLSYLHHAGWISCPDFVFKRLRQARLTRWERLDVLLTFYAGSSPRNITHRRRGVFHFFYRAWLEYRSILSRYIDSRKFHFWIALYDFPLFFTRHYFLPRLKHEWTQWRKRLI